MDLSSLIIFIPALLVAMTIHEASHALMGYVLGDHTAKDEGRISLNPLAHIDPIFTVLIPAVMIALNIPPILAAKPVPFNPFNLRYGEFGAALVAIAGPVSNLLLALASAVLLKQINSDGIASIVAFFITLNISLAVFNLVPWPPLDGSRVLYAFAPEPLRRLMDQIESLGMYGLIIFILVGWQLVGPLVQNIEDFILNTIL